jgi:hypothetical protein
MGWMPDSAWLTKLQVASSAADLNYDLAIDASGQNAPSRVDAGFDLAVLAPIDQGESAPALVWVAVVAGIIAVAGLFALRLQPRGARN